MEGSLNILQMHKAIQVSFCHCPHLVEQHTVVDFMFRSRLGSTTTLRRGFWFGGFVVPLVVPFALELMRSPCSVRPSNFSCDPLVTGAVPLDVPFYS